MTAIVPALSRMNSVHISLPYFCNFRFNIILSYRTTSSLSTGLFYKGAYGENYVRPSHFIHACHVSYISYINLYNSVKLYLFIYLFIYIFVVSLTSMLIT
jgi:hypothetical protein